MRSAPPARRRRAAIRCSCASSCTRSPSKGLVPTEANVPRLRELEARAGSRAVSLRLAWLPPEATALAQGRRGPRRRRRSTPGRGARRPGRTRSLRGGRGPRPGRRAPVAAAARVRPSPDPGGRLRLSHPARAGRRSRAGRGAPGRRGRRAGARRRAPAAQLRRRAGQRAWRRCARPPAARARAGLPRARSPICAAPSTSPRLPPSAPRCWSSSARPRRGSAARRRSSICKLRAS